MFTIFYNFFMIFVNFVGLLWFFICALIRGRPISHVNMKSIRQVYSVVKVFSLNRIIFLAETQAFTHCCELLLVLGKMFSLQYRKAKTVWENVYMYNFDIVWNLYRHMLCQLYVVFCQILLWYVIVSCFRPNAYGYWGWSYCLYDCMADVIAICL